MRSSLLALAVVVLSALPPGLPSARAAQCGLVDGATDGSTEPDWDGDGVPDCLDHCPTVPNDPNVDADGDTIPDACDCNVGVTTFVDGSDGECVEDCTLREAVALAPSACTIRLSSGTYVISSPLNLDRTVSLIGAGAGATEILYSGSDYALRAGHATQLSEVYLGAMAVRTSSGGLTLPPSGPTYALLSNVRVESGPGALGCRLILTGVGTVPVRDVSVSNSIFRGGDCGIRLDDPDSPSSPTTNTLTCRNCLVTEIQGNGVTIESTHFAVDLVVAFSDSTISHCTGAGGFAGDHLIATRTVIVDNSSDGVVVPGGGPFVQPGNASLTECEIAGNGGIGLSVRGSSEFAPAGTADLHRSTVHSNGTGVSVGAALCVSTPPYCQGHAGRVSLTDSTVAGNEGAGLALEASPLPPTPGGTLSDPSANLIRSTLAHNALGVSIWDDHPAYVGTLDVAQSVIAANATDCDGPVTSGGYNFLGSAAGCAFAAQTTDTVDGGDPGLQPLADNGGHTPTLEPSLGSPLIDAGSPSCDDLDQRGVPRPFGAACDVGAVEHAEAVLFDRATYACDDVVDITLLDESISGNGTQDVSVSSTSETGGEQVSLSEVTPGHFTSQVQIVSQQPPVSADGVVSVVDGDTLTAVYLDLDDGAGGGPIVRQATAAIACPEPPEGACCRQDDACSIETDFACGLDHWLGADTTCDQCPCIPECPEGSVAEGEPVCGHNYADTYNGSCSLAKPLEFNDTVCGASGQFSTSGGGLGTDLDWYFFTTITQQNALTLTVDAGFPVVASIVNSSSGCAAPTVVASGQTPDCQTLTLSTVVDAGTFGVTVRPVSAATTPPCPADYKVTLRKAPVSPVNLSVSFSSLSWMGPGPRYDVLRGDLELLRSSGGNFTTATQQCLANNVSGPTLNYSSFPFNPDEGWWFLVRATPVTGIPHSYDSGGPGQVGSRDAEINEATSHCP